MAVEISQFHHTPYYCEENVYMLCKKLCALGIAEPDASDLFVVFISNDKKQIPMWQQKASSRPDGLVLWDYHVICIQKTRGNSLALVWDLDSKLPIPTPLASYVSESIKSSFHLFPEFQRCFRIVHAPIFLKNFASDRRHMIDQDGAWLHQPPDYEPIVAADGTEHNLNEFMNIHSIEVVNSSELESISGIFSKKLGVVTTENQLEDFLHLLFAAMKSLNGIATDATMSIDLKE
ncbi:unnamed protein product [Rhodiola kirilowii]